MRLIPMRYMNVQGLRCNPAHTAAISLDFKSESLYVGLTTVVFRTANTAFRHPATELSANQYPFGLPVTECQTT
jgi:hypothetical protein